MSESAGVPRGGLGIVRWLLILVLVVLGLGIVLRLARSFPQQVAQATPTPLTSCPTTWDGAPVFIVRLSRAKYPASTQHIDDARRLLGKPWVLTLDRPGADQRRADATKNFPRVAGQQPDEYPPALAKEGGVNADVRNIPSGDNQGAGASMGNQLRGQPDGSLFCIDLTP